MKLSSRLLFVTRFIEKDMVIADIGSDHGFLPFYLLENNLITKAYACDNKIGPYNNLKKTFADHFPNKIELALNDGLNNLPSYVNCVIMTGMGGDLIIKLLSRDNQYLNNVNYLILSPQSNIPLVREYVSNNGFKIIDEGLVEDDKIYTVIKCQKGQQVLNQKELYFGPILVNNKDNLFMNLYSKRLDEIQELLNKNLSIERINQLTEEVNLIKEVLNEK